MADLEAVLADVSYLMAMEKSKSTPAARASKKITLPEPRYRRLTVRSGGHRGRWRWGGGQRSPAPSGRPGGVGGSGDAGSREQRRDPELPAERWSERGRPMDGARRGAVPASGTSRRDGKSRIVRAAGGAGGRRPGAALAALALRSRERSRR